MKKLSSMKVVALQRILSKVCCLSLVVLASTAVNGCALFFYEPEKPEGLDKVSVKELIGK